MPSRSTRGGQLVACGLALLGAVALSACGSSSDDTTSSTGATGSSGASDKAVSIAMLVPQLNNTYTQANIKGAEGAAKAAGNATVKVFNSNFQPSVQVSQCNDAVSSGQYDAIVMQPIVGSSVIPCVKRAKAKDIKVVAIENAVGPSFDTLKPQVDGVVGSVFVPATYEADRVLKQLYAACGDAPCEVAQLIGVAGFGFDAARDAHIDEALKDHPNIKIVSRQPTGFLEAKATTEMKTILQAHPDINVLLTSGDQIALGAQKAIEQSGKKVGEDGIKVILTGAAEETIPKIKDGEWYASGVMMPITTGRTGAEIAVKSVRGEPIANSEVLVPETIVKGGEITKDNVDQVKPEYAAR